jgi:hypothetical protein
MRYERRIVKKIVEGSFRDLIGVLSRQLTRWIEENHEHFSQNSLYSGRGQNQASPEYKSRAVPLIVFLFGQALQPDI